MYFGYPREEAGVTPKMPEKFFAAGVTFRGGRGCIEVEGWRYRIGTFGLCSRAFRYPQIFFLSRESPVNQRG